MYFLFQPLIVFNKEDVLYLPTICTCYQYITIKYLNTFVRQKYKKV